jgi:hypothetical protein
MSLITLYLTFAILLYSYDKYDLYPFCLWIFPISNFQFKYGDGKVGTTAHFFDILLHVILILTYLDFIGVVNIVVKIC